MKYSWTSLSSFPLATESDGYSTLLTVSDAIFCCTALM